ncbi:MAG: GNAT family N-acetyltransferase [Armatimonadetes bacterium]|nr:GNAT family N-acetyltransferase [Armatimonadota bacterium]
MASSSHEPDSSSPTPELRAARPDEQGDLLALWQAVWGEDGAAYFRAYLEGDPWFQDRYCRVARVEGRIVSSALICRRPIRFGARELTMGGIANVATLREHRRRGYSGELLRQCVRVMEEDGFDFSALGTGIHRHYERHGWFKVEVPGSEVRLREGEGLPPADPEIAPLALEQWLAEAPPVYAAFNGSLALCFERSLEYWNGWIRIRAAGWRADRLALLGLWNDGMLDGYLLAALPENPDDGLHVHELAAIRHEDLPRLLTAAARVAGTAGVKRLCLRAPNLPVVTNFLPKLGEPTSRTHDGVMLRRIHAEEHVMAEITRSYEMGLAAWWMPDDF